MAYVFESAEDRARLERTYDRDPYNVEPEIRAIFDAERFPDRNKDEQRRIDENKRRAEADAREQNTRKAEDAARVTKTGLLPRTVDSLKYVPKDKHAQFERQMDGSFRLMWIDMTDENAMLEYLPDIAAGRITARSAGYNADDNEREGKARERQVNNILADLDAKDAQRRETERNAAIARSAAEINARYGR